MGCFQSKEADAAGALGAGGAAALQLGAGKEQEVTALRRAVWKADPPMTAAELQRKRDEFWDTQPHYGGAREIWDALRAAAALDAATARAVLDAVEVKVMRRDMSVSYDARGFRYELPNYVLSDPTNLLP